MTPTNADRYAEVHEATDERIPCTRCGSMANARKTIHEGDMIIGMLVYCTDCGCSINTAYTREWMDLLRQDEEQAERERQAYAEDLRRESRRRAVTGGFF